jgi:hypothetical protein
MRSSDGIEWAEEPVAVDPETKIAAIVDICETGDQTIAVGVQDDFGTVWERTSEGWIERSLVVDAVRLTGCAAVGDQILLLGATVEGTALWGLSSDWAVARIASPDRIDSGGGLLRLGNSVVATGQSWVGSRYVPSLWSSRDGIQWGATALPVPPAESVFAEPAALMALAGDDRGIVALIVYPRGLGVCRIGLGGR